MEDKSKLYQIHGLPGYYITENAELWSNKTGTKWFKMALFKCKSGYLGCMCVQNGKKRYFMLHRLMAITFIPNPENKREVNHKDCDRLNNSIENLEWCTPKENTHHSIINGRKPIQYGEDVKSAKLTAKEVLEIYYLITNKIMKRRQIAKIYNISKDTVSAIKGKRTWSHLFKTITPEQLSERYVKAS